MIVTLLPGRRQVTFDKRLRVSDLLQQLGLLPGTAMVIRDDELLTEEEYLEPTDSVEVRNVISGG